MIPYALTPIAHAIAIAYGRWEQKPQIPTSYQLLERLYYAKAKRSLLPSA